MISQKHAYYYALKARSRSAVVDSFNEKIDPKLHQSPWRGMLISSITKEATDAARLEWPRYYSDATHRGFIESWERLYNHFVHVPSFFDVAIWQTIDGENRLQGLALGKPSDGKTHLTLHWVERTFAPHYMRGGILMPILACAEEYAKVLTCERVLIKNPVEPSKYASYGYEPYEISGVKAAYLCKDV